ncbi:MAG TPA: hypothetical protein V6D50_22540 [Chroococcales cyanobacterium]|jgi:hypothetical protein
MMTYKQWTIVTKKELNGIAVDYTDPEGNHYSEPFCFQNPSEALRYAQICIDRRLIASNSKVFEKAYS